MNVFDEPIHANGLSASQLLLPCLIELCDDFLCFLLAKLYQILLILLKLGFIKSFSDTSLIFSFPLYFCPHAHLSLQFHHHPSYLEPLDGLLTGRAEDAVVEVADGPGATG